MPFDIIDDDMTELSFSQRIARLLTQGGPVPIAYYMHAANEHYYATRDPLGAAGDFITAPEISQMFGELLGIWAFILWHEAGEPDFAWVELGPGRGTLTVDALRTMGLVGLRPPVHFVETSPALRAAQALRVPKATWHDNLDTLPADRALIVIANEFFDALPIRQHVRAPDAWRERLVAFHESHIIPIFGAIVPDAVVPAQLRDAPLGSTFETSPASRAVVRDLARRLVAQGGAALVIDYGYEGPAIGDTFQAVRAHGYANPFEDPGNRDLSAHVDFTALGTVARAEGAVLTGPSGQGRFLEALGIEPRAARLGPTATPAFHRLVDEMGILFKVLAIRAPHWPIPQGFP